MKFPWNATFIVLALLGTLVSWPPGSGVALWANEQESSGGPLGTGIEENKNQTSSDPAGMIPWWDRVWSYREVIQHALRYPPLRVRPLDFEGFKEADSSTFYVETSGFSRSPGGVSKLADGRTMTFEIIQSKLKRKEVFFSFHFTLDPRDSRMFLEMALTPSAEANISFWFPFSGEK